MKKKVKVKLIKTNKDLESFFDEIDDVNQKEREKILNDMVRDFEVYLLNEAIRLKSMVLFIVNYIKYEELKNGTRGEAVFKSFVDKDAAYEFLSHIKTIDFYASVCDYHFDKLLNMSDNEFESLPDLGCKDLKRRYREVMRVDIEQNVYKVQNEAFAKPHRTYNVLKTRTEVVEKVREKLEQKKSKKNLQKFAKNLLTTRIQ